MDPRTAEMLSSLLQLEEDAVRAYDQAITACDVMEVKVQLREFREQHEVHARVLSERLLAAGERVQRRDEKGFLIEGFAARMGTLEEILTGLRQDEELMNRSYRSVLSHELAADTREAVERAHEDAKAHLAWIQSAISARIWERAA